MEGKFNRIFERILIFTTSTSLMLTVMGVFSFPLNKYEVDKVFINFFVYLVIGISGLIFSLVLQIFALEKIKSAMHIVFIFFYTVAVVLIAALLGEGYAPYVLIPSLLVQYFICVGINDMFIFHDKFLHECEAYNGKELETYLFHNNLTAIDLTEKTKTQEVVLFGLSVAMFIILVFGKLSDGHFNLFIDCLIIIFFLSVLLCYFTLGLFRNDIFYAFLGYKDYIQNKKSLFRVVLLIFLISCGLAIFISSDNALIKINYYLKDYSEELKDDPPAVTDNFNFTPLPEFDYADDFGREAKPNWIIELIFQIIKYGVLVFLGGSVIYFLVKPFFTSHWKSFWTEGRLITFLRELWKDIKTFFRFILSKNPSKGQAYSTVQSKKFRDSMKDFLKKARRSREKEAEIDRLTKHFMKLIDWGEAHKIKYRSNLAPAEYTALIEKEVEDELQKSARSAGQLFEKALYDKNVLSAEEEASFVESIKRIIQS